MNAITLLPLQSPETNGQTIDKHPYRTVQCCSFDAGQELVYRTGSDKHEAKQQKQLSSNIPQSIMQAILQWIHFILS